MALSMFLYFVWIAGISVVIGRVFHILEKKQAHRAVVPVTNQVITRK